MLCNKEGKRLTEFASDYIVFDLETTGISPYKDKVIEISALKVKDHVVTDEFDTLVNPQCHISGGASAVNGIYDDMVEDAPVFSEVLPQFFDFVGELPLVGHNIIAFDLKFIYRDAREFLGSIPDNDFIDTLYIARKCLPELAHHRMTDLAAHYGISTEGAHRALADCRMTQQVYEYLQRDTERFEAGGKQIPLCKACGRRMKLRNGKYGEFWGCPGYPRCSFTLPYNGE